jgi:hypothetical protein
MFGLDSKRESEELARLDDITSVWFRMASAAEA